MQSKKLIGYNINLGSYDSFINTIISSTDASAVPYYVCVANVHMLMEAYKSETFAQILNEANLVTPDGKPITWALKFLSGITQPRVAGMDLLPDLLSVSARQKIPVAFYGGSQAVLDKTAEQIKINYPDLIIGNMYSPPFRTLTAEEDQLVIDMINNSGARLLFVVLGCPKQEKWMASMMGKIHAVMVGIGGALPVLVGMQKRAPVWMQNAGLEWFYRFAQEPKRLFKRYAVTNSLFIYLVMKEKYFSRHTKNNIRR